MTRRMLAAIANPHLDILGHCTGRKVSPPAGATGRATGRTGAAGPGRRATSTRTRCFAACVEHGKAVEINSRPDRLDPPKRLLRRGGRGGLPVHHRHRRARARPARLAAVRLRAGRAVRRRRRPGGQHLAGSSGCWPGRTSRTDQPGRARPLRADQLAFLEVGVSRSAGHPDSKETESITLPDPAVVRQRRAGSAAGVAGAPTPTTGLLRRRLNSPCETATPSQHDQRADRLVPVEPLVEHQHADQHREDRDR